MQLTGVWLWGMAARELNQQGTPAVTVSTSDPPSKLCQSGVFAFSRNPMCASPPCGEEMCPQEAQLSRRLTSRR
jgi:hypothetical protein